MQQAMDNIFGTSGSSDPSAPAYSVPAIDIGSMFDQLSNLMSGLSNNVNTWASDAINSDPARAQDFESATQNVNGAVDKLIQMAQGGMPQSFDDFTQSVLCDMVDSLNAVVDSGVADFGFDLLPFTVDQFDMSNFMGKWYQVYAGQFVIASAETNMACIESEYKQTGDTTFDLTDSWTATDNKKSSASRTGKAEERSTAQMRVQYDDEQRCLSHGLWVLGTGPVVNGKYDWAIVSDPFAISVRVLARDPAAFKEKYESQVLPAFENSFQGFLHVMVPIDQTKCPDRQPATPVPAPAPKPQKPTPAVVSTVTKPKPAPTNTPVTANNAQLQDTQSNAAPVASTPSDDDDDDDTGLWVALGCTIAALVLILLGILAYCCVRRRRQQAKVMAAVAPATKLAPSSNDKLLPTNQQKSCTFCQGPQCVYGGQVEHDLARKLENVDYSAAGNVSSA